MPAITDCVKNLGVEGIDVLVCWAIGDQFGDGHMNNHFLGSGIFNNRGAPPVLQQQTAPKNPLAVNIKAVFKRYSKASQQGLYDVSSRFVAQLLSYCCSLLTVLMCGLVWYVTLN